MAPKKRYPLEPLLQKREEEVDVRARELRERMEAARQAELRRQRALRERQDHARWISVETQGEADRFDAGDAAAQDMMRLHAWRLAQACRAEELAQRESAARERVEKADRQEGEARAQLAQARAGAKVIEQHRDRFEAEERKAEERKAEGEVEDLVNARWSRRKA